MCGRVSLPSSILLAFALLLPSLASSTPPDDLRFITSTLWSDPGGVKIAGETAYVSYWNGVAVLDVSDPAVPLLRGRAFCFGATYALDAAGSYVYLAQGMDGMRIVDVSDPANPVEVGWHGTGGEATDIAVRTGFAYMACGHWTGLEIYDVNDPAAPVPISTCDTNGACGAISLNGDYAYLADGHEGVAVIDLSDLDHPVLAAQWPIGFIVDIEIDGNRAYCVWAGGENARGGVEGRGGVTWFDPSGVVIYDISDPLNPLYLGAYASQDGARGIHVDGYSAYVPSGDGSVVILDVSNPGHPVVAGRLLMADPWSLDTQSGIAYVADGRGGLRIADVSDPAAPQVLGSYWEAGSPMEVAIGDRAAYLTDSSYGLHVMDVADPTHPIPLGRLAIPDGALGIAVSEPYIYLIQSTGIMIVSVSDPARPAPVNRLALAVSDLALSGVYAYAVNDDRFTSLDVSDPIHPVIVGSCVLPLWAWNVTVCGNFAYVGNSNAGLRIVDVSNPSHPLVRGGIDTFDWAFDLVSDGSYVYANLGRNRLGVFDVTNPDAPLQIANVQMPGFLAGLTLVGDRLFCAADPGVIVVDVSNPASPVFAGMTRAAGSSIDVHGSYVFLLGGGSFIVLGPALSDVSVEEFAWDGIRLAVRSPILGTAPIAVDLDRGQALRVSIFDVTGRRVASIHDGIAPSGLNRMLWNPGAVPAGVYYLRAEAGGQAAVRKLLLLK